MGTNAAHFTDVKTEAQKRRPECQRHPAPKPSSTRPRGCPPEGLLMSGAPTAALLGRPSYGCPSPRAHVLKRGGVCAFQ